MKNLPYFIFCGRRHRAAFLLEFERIKGNREAGRSPVFCEMRSFCGVIANFIFTIAKHALRIRFLRKIGLEATEDNIAVLESMEYQTV